MAWHCILALLWSADIGDKREMQTECEFELVLRLQSNKRQIFTKQADGDGKVPLLKVGWACADGNLYLSMRAPGI
jgi:hypothetical protein